MLHSTKINLLVFAAAAAAAAAAGGGGCGAFFAISFCDSHVNVVVPPPMVL